MDSWQRPEYLNDGDAQAEDAGGGTASGPSASRDAPGTGITREGRFGKFAARQHDVQYTDRGPRERTASAGRDLRRQA